MDRQFSPKGKNEIFIDKQKYNELDVVTACAFVQLTCHSSHHT